MKLKNDFHLVSAPFGGGHYNAFELPDVIDRLQKQYYNWVKANAAELTSLLENAASSHLMFDDVTDESEAVELQYQVSHNGEQWIAYMHRDGLRLRYADPDYKGEDNFSWFGLESEPYLLGQVIADPVVRKLLA